MVFHVVSQKTFAIVHTIVFGHSTNAYKVLRDSYKYFTFVSHIVFLHICDHLSIPCFKDIFVFAKVYKVLGDIQKYFIFEPY